MVIVWLLYGYCMVIVWLLYGYCMVIVWLRQGRRRGISERFPEDFRKIFGRFLTFELSERYFSENVV